MCLLALLKRYWKELLKPNLKHTIALTGNVHHDDIQVNLEKAMAWSLQTKIDFASKNLTYDKQFKFSQIASVDPCYKKVVDLIGDTNLPLNMVERSTKEFLLKEIINNPLRLNKRNDDYYVIGGLATYTLLQNKLTDIEKETLELPVLIIEQIQNKSLWMITELIGPLLRIPAHKGLFIYIYLISKTIAGLDKYFEDIKPENSIFLIGAKITNQITQTIKAINKAGKKTWIRKNINKWMK